MTLVGPFNFDPINTSNRVKQKVHKDQWNKLSEVCKFMESSHQQWEQDLVTRYHRLKIKIAIDVKEKGENRNQVRMSLK